MNLFEMRKRTNYLSAGGKKMKYTIDETQTLSPLHRSANGSIRLIPGERATVKDILDFLPELDIWGFRCYGDAKHRELRAKLLNPDALGGLSQANVERLHNWLCSFHASHRWKHRSYALKHTFERETGTYMMNGAFIVCVLMAGFEIQIDGPSALMK